MPYTSKANVTFISFRDFYSRYLEPRPPLLDFAIAFSIGQAIAFGLIATGFASATGRLYPAVMVPAFAVPTFIMLHAVSLRQLWRQDRAARSL